LYISLILHTLVDISSRTIVSRNYIIRNHIICTNMNVGGILQEHYESPRYE